MCPGHLTYFYPQITPITQIQKQATPRLNARVRELTDAATQDRLTSSGVPESLWIPTAPWDRCDLPHAFTPQVLNAEPGGNKLGKAF